MTESGSVADNVSKKRRGKGNKSIFWFKLLLCSGIATTIMGVFLPKIFGLTSTSDLNPTAPSAVEVLCGIFGLVTPFLFGAAIYFLLNTQKEKLKRSTIYILWSVGTAFLSVLFLEMGLHIDESLGGGLPYLYIIAFAALLAFANIIVTGEILKLSGIAKILLLLVAGWMLGRLGVLELERVRQESHKLHSVQVQSPIAPPQGDQNDLSR